MRTSRARLGKGSRSRREPGGHIILWWKWGFPRNLAVVKNRAYNWTAILVLGWRLFPVAEP